MNNEAGKLKCNHALVHISEQSMDSIKTEHLFLVYCSIIEPFVFDTLMTVEGTCGIAARNTLIRMIERTIVVPELKNKLDEICPNLVDAIQRKIRSLNQSTNHYGNSFDGPIMSPP